MSEIVQAVYVLAADGWDHYAPMTCVSASTLRHTCPEACVLLLVDQYSWNLLHAHQHNFAKVFDKVIRVETDFSDAMVRSRFLKTSIRKHIQGDFIFLDSDTLVLRPITELMKTKAPVAAVLDYTITFGEPGIPASVIPLYSKLGWQYPMPHFFNAGVIFLRDIPAAHTFCESWHQKWHQSKAVGWPRDQPAMNSALWENKIEVEVLGGEYNAFILPRPWCFPGCRIAHFWDSIGYSQNLLRYLIVQFKRSGSLDIGAIEKCIKDGHPWGPDQSYLS